VSHIDETSDRARALLAQLHRLEAEYGPMPVMRQEGGEDADTARARRMASWLQAIGDADPDDVAEGVSDLLRTWERYGRPWPDLGDLVRRIPRRPVDPQTWALWERVQRAALYGERDGLDERALAAIGGEGSLPGIADRLESGRMMPMFRRFAERLASLPALPAPTPLRALPAHVAQLVAAATAAPDPSRRTRASRAVRLLDETDIPEPTKRPDGWSDEQRRALAERFGGER
jgi:hypothetical protein